MRFDLKTPCKNCPFRTDATAIRFRCRERAEEIEESAYRYGFPCHLSADHIEGDDEGESGGFVFGEETQHCAGALIMHTRHGAAGPIPFTHLDDEEQERIRERLDFEAPVFESEDAFIESYPETEGD